jgi:ATP-binding protein involved in chromosome partitioning
LADKLGVPLIGQVPFVPAVREGGDVGAPVLATDPASEVALALDGIADWVAAHGPKRRFRRELTIR